MTRQKGRGGGNGASREQSPSRTVQEQDAMAGNAQEEVINLRVPTGNEQISPQLQDQANMNMLMAKLNALTDIVNTLTVEMADTQSRIATQVSPAAGVGSAAPLHLAAAAVLSSSPPHQPAVSTSPALVSGPSPQPAVPTGAALPYGPPSYVATSVATASGALTQPSPVMTPTVPPSQAPASTNQGPVPQPGAGLSWPLTSGQPIAPVPSCPTPPVPTLTYYGATPYQFYGNSTTPQPPAPTTYIMSREEVPIFKGETPASKPLQRNQDIEAWIYAIENLTRPTDEMRIRTARGRARGFAQMLIQSPMFDHITTWNDFKAKLRMKFRGTCSSSHFYDMLSRSRMAPPQTPLDFYQQVEMAVFQGVRDFPNQIGDAEDLLRRTFLQGVPLWLRQQLSPLAFPSAMHLAEATQQAWNATAGMGESLPLATYTQDEGDGSRQHEYYSRGHQQSFQRPPPHNNISRQAALPHETASLDYYQDYLFLNVSAVTQSPPQQATAPSAPEGRRKWCEYHKSDGHSSSDCYVINKRCFKCGGYNHIRADCPFLERRGGETSHYPPGMYQPQQGRGSTQGQAPGATMR